MEVHNVPHEHGWMPRARWDALVRGDGCALCAELSQADRINPFGFPVADLAFSRLRLAANQAARGYCVLICRRHIREPFELVPEEQLRYWQDLMRVGRVVQAVFDPIKVKLTFRCSAISCRTCTRTSCRGTTAIPHLGAPSTPAMRLTSLTPMLPPSSSSACAQHSRSNKASGDTRLTFIRC